VPVGGGCLLDRPSLRGENFCWRICGKTGSDLTQGERPKRSGGKMEGDTLLLDDESLRLPKGVGITKRGGTIK